MKNLAFRTWHYCQHLLWAGNEHRLHSPFLFEWYKEVVAHKKDFYAFYMIKERKKAFLAQEKVIEIEDFGAKGTENRLRKVKIAQLAQQTTVNSHKGEFLFRMVDYFRPQSILELGTSLGISTAYLWEAAPPNAQMYSFEGSAAVLNIAQKNFKNSPIRFVLGNIDQQLPQELSLIDKLDFVFFDANHRYQPTKDYFEMCLSKAHEDTIFVFDDIYWSPEMQKAWQQISKHSAVGFAIDFFHLGVIFFRKKQAQQHFRLKM